MTILESTSRLAAAGGNLFPFRTRCSHTPLPVSLFTGILAALAMTLPCLAHADAVTLSSDTDIATAGYFQLSWQNPTPADELVLYESDSENFSNSKVIYQGADLATVISGKSDGQYFYRLGGAENSISSNTVAVTVRHHPLVVAFSFFTVGAIVFLATLVVVVTGNRTAR